MDTVGMFSPPSTHEPPGTSASEAKRRKTRKGTRSCWECKRRKVRCEFSSPEDAVCICCRRRGADCISQEFPEDTPLIEVERSHSSHVDERLARVESIVGELVKLIKSNPTAITTPDTARTSSTPIHLWDRGSETVTRAEIYAPLPNEHEKLSHELYMSLPSREDVKRICDAARDLPFYLIQYMQQPQLGITRIDIENTKQRLLDAPGPNAHPILIARHILTLAIFLQYLHQDCHEDLSGMSEAPYAMMQRLADTVILFMAPHGKLLGSVEGVECIVLEGTFYANLGSLRNALMSFRRAIGIAQLIGMHRPACRQLLNFLDSEHKMADPQFLWFRIMYVDRFLSLKLGLPPGSPGNSFMRESEMAADTPMGRLERIHASVAERISVRNDAYPCVPHYRVTQEIDDELQKAAGALSGQWWLAPNLSGLNDLTLFRETLRLVNQLYHYNLLNQLHLPYMLSGSSVADEEVHQNYDYSKLACTNASREILSRFIMFRRFNHAIFCCRAIDFYGLMAAMTLLLAHLNSHRQDSPHGSPSSHLLAHQRLVDRAMMEQVLESMDRMGRLNNDALSEQSATLVRRLLTIENEAAEGRSFRTKIAHGVESASEKARAAKDTGGDEHVLSLPIPYLGVVKISRLGIISREAPGNDARRQDGPLPPQPLQEGNACTIEPGQFITPISTTVEGVNMQQLQCMHPTFIGDTSDSVFQGVDLAFFSNLMRGVSGAEDTAAWSDSWNTWQADT
ncbi:hypothetical protein GQ53DRAFT_735853 [Thozetella sp. PMI_491]|nr:hypothetical protein GQ53DRAFT_735853 [Thozetella sp. PMI_491]